jgi:hypothetical protein
MIILCGRVGQLLGFERNRTEHSESRRNNIAYAHALAAEHTEHPN